MDGDGKILGAVQHEVGQQIVVPDPHNLQNAHGDHGRPQHGEHHGKIGAQRTAAVYGGGLLNLQGDRLYKANKHEDGKARAEAKIDDGNGPGGIEGHLVKGHVGKVEVRDLDPVGRLRQGKHDHLEWDDHGKDTQVIDDAAELAVHPGDIPGRHRGTQQNQCRGDHGDEQAVKCGFPEGIVTEGHALDIVGPAGKALPIGKSKGIGLDVGIELEGVEHHHEDGQHIDDADNRQHNGQNQFAASFGGKGTFHYCCTSFLRVARS